jgi:uncharacterized protein
MAVEEHFYKVEEKDIKRSLVNLSQLIFEVTEGCNLNCKYCGYGEIYQTYGVRKKSSLSFDVARKVLDYLANLWNENIEISLKQPLVINFYGGEPLLNMKLIQEIIQYTGALDIKGKKIFYGMTTNALLLDKYMDYLADNNFRLMISLDGNKEDHSYRVDHQGINSHKQVVENSRLLRQKHPEYFKKHVKFNTVLHSKNSVEGAFTYIQRNFDKKTKISPLNNSGIREDKIDEFKRIFQHIGGSIDNSSNQKQLESELFLESPKTMQLTNFLFMYSGNMYDSYSSLLADSNKMKVKPTGTCIPFDKKMYVTATGKILPCEKISYEFAMGQVSEHGVEMDLESIAKMTNHYSFKFVNQCKTCVHMKSCIQCVYQIDGLKKETQKCKGYTSIKTFQKIIGANMDYLGKNPDLYGKIMKEIEINH